MRLPLLQPDPHLADSEYAPILRVPSFWVLQLGGWLIWAAGLAISTFPVWRHGESIVFRFVQFAASFLCSFPLHAICRFLWRRRVGLLLSLAVCGFAAIPMGITISAVILYAEQLRGNLEVNFSLSYVLVYMTNGAVLLMAWSGLYFGIKHYQRAECERAQAVFSASLAREAQQRALRYQLQPHFLFNTLNAISTLVLDDEPRHAVLMITKLSALLRSTLEAPDIHQVCLSTELETAREYLQIEEIRFGNRLCSVVNVQPEALSAEVPRFLLQPLLENAVRHGISRLFEGGTINIESFVAGAVLTIKVSNDLPMGAPTEHRFFGEPGLGLANTRERLRSSYGAEGIVRAAMSSDGRFDVTIHLPFRVSTSFVSYSWKGPL